MAVLNPLSLSERLNAALSQQSIVLRCQELANLLQEVSSKDGAYVLQSVIESLFGTSEESVLTVQQQQLGGGWGLRIITYTEHRVEFQTLRAFLSPSGPLLSLIYRLSNDPFQLLPFPISWLPAKVCIEIKEGNATPFYTSKIQNFGPGKTLTNILFNAFEYYFFHFGYFLVGNWAHQWNFYWTSVRDSLYPTLLEDYLSSYLPCDASLPPGPPVAPVVPRGIFSPVSQRPSSGHGFYSSAPNFYILASPTGSPFRPHENTNFDASSIGNFSVVGSHQISSPLHPSAPNSEINTWTSQALIQVLMEIWINLCVPPPATVSRYHPASIVALSQASLNNHPSLSEVFVPMGDHVRAVRMLVKHFHYFSNSLKPHHASPLDPLRRNIWSICHKSLYFFIKHLFLHWPLDSSFRLVLETWLSYIQPWRYVTYAPIVRSPGVVGAETEITHCMESKWKLFIAENLLFYTYLFSLLIRRILRLDLSSSKNALILFRVTKVFSQGNLLQLIQEVEELLETTQIQKSLVGFVGGLSSPPGFHGSHDVADGHLPQVITQMVRSHILNVEKANFHYVPLFGEVSLRDVDILLKQTKSVHDTLNAELSEHQGTSQTPIRESGNWWNSLCKVLFESSQVAEDETSIDEMQKCAAHLDAAISQLSAIFNIPICKTSAFSPSSQRTQNQLFNTSISGTPEKSGVPDLMLTTAGPKLTKYGRHQLMSGLRRLDINYEGDPELRPICTYEVAFLVRGLHALAKLINTKYEVELINCFYRRDFLGNLCRVFLTPPQTVYVVNKKYETDHPYRKAAKDLPPRISLRPLAQKKLLGYVVICYALFYLLGFSSTRVTLQLVIPLFFMYVLCKATLKNHQTSTFMACIECRDRGPSTKPST